MLNARFEPGHDEHQSRTLKLRRLSNSRGIQGEIVDVAKQNGRGNKSQGGRMCMYGFHARRASGDSEKVPDRAQKWPDSYNPSGQPIGPNSSAAMQAVAAHAGALERLEAELLPEAGAARSLIADGSDPAKAFRVSSVAIDGSPARSAGTSLSLTNGYVVVMHNDSGAALEAIGFAYAAQAPLPDDHEWLFAVAGCIHPLPVDRDGFVFVAVRGKGVHHGTLPTSSTQPHFANHGGVGSALVNKADLVALLDKPGPLPWPTREELKAQQEAVAKEKAADKTRRPLAKAVLELPTKQRALEHARRDMQAALRSAAEAVGDAVTEAAGEAAAQGGEGSGVGGAGGSAQDELEAARQALHDVERQVAEAACDEMIAATAARLQAVAGLDPLIVDGEVAAAAEEPEEVEEGPDTESEAESEEEEEEEEEEPAAAVVVEGLPGNRVELLAAITDPAREFGLLQSAESTLATPAINALKAKCKANGVDVPASVAAHKKGQPLPEGCFIVKVCSKARPDSNPTSTPVSPWGRPSRNCKVTDLTLAPKPYTVSVGPLYVSRQPVASPAPSPATWCSSQCSRACASPPWACPPRACRSRGVAARRRWSCSSARRRAWRGGTSRRTRRRRRSARCAPRCPRRRRAGSCCRPRSSPAGSACAPRAARP